MKASGMDSSGYPVAPGSESSHYARHGLSSFFGQLGRVRNGLSPLKMVMQASLHAARSTAVKGRRARSKR